MLLGEGILTDSYHLLDGGRYQIEKLVQKARWNAPWVIHIANDLLMGRKVIIKQLNTVTLRTVEQWEFAHDLLCREVALLRRMHHPQIPALVGTFYEGQQLNIVMRYFEGATLEDQLRRKKEAGRGRCLQAEVVDFCLQMCSILSYTHTLTPPIIHRDIKPTNIVCTRDGRYSLVDFGNGREFGSHRPLTGLNLWKTPHWDTIQGIGSPGYAPPEQYQMSCEWYPSGLKPARTTLVSDLYAVGAIAHEMLTGIDPAQKEDEGQFAYLPLEEYVLRGVVHPEIALLVEQLLEYDPAKRPQSAQEVMHRLCSLH